MILLRALAYLAVGTALLLLGCGGKAVDDPSGKSESGDGDSNQSGDVDMPSPDLDPLSEEGFRNVATQAFAEYCEGLEACDAVPDGLTCEGELDNIALLYDIDSRLCRELILASLECINDSSRNCTIVGSDCVSSTRELDEQCGQFTAR